MFVTVEMFDIQKCALPILFSDFDFFANLQGQFPSPFFPNDHPCKTLFVMSPHFRVGDMLLLPGSSVHPFVCPSQNSVRCVTQKSFEIFS